MRRLVKSVVDDVAVTPLFSCRGAIRLASIRTLNGPFAARCMIVFGAIKCCNLFIGMSVPEGRGYLPGVRSHSNAACMANRRMNAGVPVAVVFNCGTINLSARKTGQSWRGTRAPCGRIYGSGRAVASSLFRFVIAGILQCGKLRGFGGRPPIKTLCGRFGLLCVLVFQGFSVEGFVHGSVTPQCV